MGSEHYGVAYVDFVLSPGENITEVHGRAGDLIDMLGFKTNFGRSQTFGTSHGGHHFSLSVHGKVVKGFRVGFGGHLHYIGAHFGHESFSGGMPMPMPVPVPGGWPSPAPSPFPAPAPGGWPSPAPVPGSWPSPAPGSWPSPAPAPGSWPSPSPVPGTAYPAPAPGSWGAPAPSFPAPSGYGAMPSPAGYPAPGGYVAPVPVPTPAYAEPHHGHHHGHHAHVQQSKHAGKNHPDTVHFDDYSHALKGKTNIRLTKLRVLHNGTSIFGIESIYDADGY